jgi:hypothetical protein
VIPAAQPPAPGSAEAFTFSKIAAPGDPTTASIIIAVAEEPTTAAAQPDVEAPTLRFAESFGSPPPTVDPLPAPVSGPAQPAMVAPHSAPLLPAAHVSRRERNRRKQLNTAIMLLAAVIVLALILIWVLQRGASQPSANETTLNRILNSWRSPLHAALVRHEERNPEGPVL